MWCDNSAFEALVADNFTESIYDSLEESDNDDIGISLAIYRSPCQLNTQYIGDIVTEVSPVEDEGTLLDDEDIEIDFGKKLYVI